MEPNQPLQIIRTAAVRRGLVFDAAIVCANVFILIPLTDLVKSTRGFHPLFGVLLIIAVLLHALGAGLKRGPLQARLAAAPRAPVATGFYIILFILFVMHYGLFAACIGLALEIFQEIPAFNALPGLTTLAPFIVMGGALWPTALTIRALIAPRRPVVADERKLRQQELMADLALYASTLVIMAWWDGVFVETLAGADKGNLLMSILLIILTTVPFAMFYLAPRLLFLVEDFRYPGTWGRILLVMLPLAKRLVMG